MTTLDLNKFKDRDVKKIIPEKVKLNTSLLKRYELYNRETVIATTEEYKKYNRSAIYLLPLIDLEIDSFEGKFINSYISIEDRDNPKIYIQTVAKVTYPLDNKYYETFIYHDKFYYYIFDLSKYKKELEHYLDSKVFKYSIESKSKVQMCNWLCHLDRIKNEKGEWMLLTNTYLVEPRFYGFKLLYSLDADETYGTPNPLLVYYRDVLKFDIEPGTSLMDIVDIDKELINLD